MNNNIVLEDNERNRLDVGVSIAVLKRWKIDPVGTAIRQQCRACGAVRLVDFILLASDNEVRKAMLKPCEECQRNKLGV